jgi:membrane protein implicated in regulation of membrane protease activity
VIAFSLVFTVVTWYRDEDTVTAAVLLIILTTVAYILAAGIHDLVFLGSVGALIFGVAAGFLTTVVRVALFFPVVFVLVWGGRRLRRFFAPATLDDENLP